jgi:hypothetical protein
MKSTVVRFRTFDGLEMTRQGNVPADVIIAQATEEFGEVTILENREGEELPDQTEQLTEQLRNVLVATRQNASVTLNQIESLDDHHELPEIKADLQKVIDAIDTELETL